MQERVCLRDDNEMATTRRQARHTKRGFAIAKVLPVTPARVRLPKKQTPPTYTKNKVIEQESENTWKPTHKTRPKRQGARCVKVPCVPNKKPNYLR